MTEEIKTVTHKGNVYQIGKHYAFSDDGKEWVLDILEGFDEEDAHPCRGELEIWRLIRIMEPSELGTITPVPIELIDGAAYMFDYRQDSRIGIYERLALRFINVDGFTLLKVCTNIRLMTVESK